ARGRRRCPDRASSTTRSRACGSRSRCRRTGPPPLNTSRPSSRTRRNRARCSARSTRPGSPARSRSPRRSEPPDAFSQSSWRSSRGLGERDRRAALRGHRGDAGLCAARPWLRRHGQLAGLVTALVAGLVVIGGTPFQISGPRGSVSVLTASIVALALAHPALGDAGAAQGPRVLGVLLVCLMMAGAIQIAFGVLGMGNALRFLPYPVISGFMVGLGILVALPQIPALLGAPGSGDWWSAIHQLPAMRPGALLVGLVT